jgi:AraC-like DNA-binding protein
MRTLPRNEVPGNEVPPPRLWEPLLHNAQHHRQPLLNWLARAAVQRQMSPAALAQELGLSPEQLLQMFLSTAEPARLSPKAWSSFAHFLGLPLVVVRCAAQDIRLEDFFTTTDMAQLFWTMPEHLEAPALLRATELVSSFAAVVAGVDEPSHQRLAQLVRSGPTPRK